MEIINRNAFKSKDLNDYLLLNNKINRTQAITQDN